MNIYTSYFANVRNLPSNIVPLAISLFLPKSWGYKLCCSELAPDRATFEKFKRDHDEVWYTQYYKNQLSKLNINRILNRLIMLGDGKDVALICYEKPGTFCHRHLVAKWLTDNGIPVSEFDTKEWKP